MPIGTRWVDVASASDRYSTAEIAITDNLLTVVDMIDSLMARYPIDPDRIVITGLSMGGYGTWDLAARYPERWAAAIPMSGSGDPDRARAMGDLPVWSWHGEEDQTVPAAGSRVMTGALERAGRQAVYTHCQLRGCTGLPDSSIARWAGQGADLLYTGWAGKGHVMWAESYDYPALAPWAFSKHRLREEAISLVWPVEGMDPLAVSWVHDAAVDSVVVSYSDSDGQTWTVLPAVAASEGVVTIADDAVADTPVFRTRAEAYDADGFMVGRSYSPRLSLDRRTTDVRPYVHVLPYTLYLDEPVTSDTLILEYVAIDVDTPLLHAVLQFSADGGASWTGLSYFDVASGQDTVRLPVNLRDLPNTPHAQFELQLTDGSTAVAVRSLPFEKRTIRAASTLTEQVAGSGAPSIAWHVVVPREITRHTYEIAFLETIEGKRYTVHNVTMNEPVLGETPLSDGVTESPVFDGLRLVVTDLPRAEVDEHLTGWSAPAINVPFTVSASSVRVGSATYELAASPADFDLVVSDAVQGQSEAMLGLTPVDARFVITNRTSGETTPFLFIDRNADGIPGKQDTIYLLSESEDGSFVLDWRLQFENMLGTAVLPASGDTFRIVTRKPVTEADRFRFTSQDLATSSVDMPRGDVTLDLYPNPTDRQLTIAWSAPGIGGETAGQLAIFDILGRRVHVRDLGWGAAARLDVQDWAAGLYFARISDGEVSQTKPFLVR
jgi:pimeloyl-ACP methyl ester carboxylesterase